MDNLDQITESIEQLGKANHEYRKANDERLAALEKGDTAKARELDQKLDRIEADLSKAEQTKAEFERVRNHMDEQKQRLEELESRIGQPGMTKVKKLEAEHRTMFEKALRQQFANPEQCGELKSLEKQIMQAKSVTIGVPAAGGYAVPEVISSSIEKLERRLSPVRDLVKVVPVGTSDYKELVSIGGAQSGWVGESDTRTGTATPQLREVTPTHGELYAYPQASEWSLDDMFFSVENWLTEETAEEFAFQEGDAVIRGDGTNKPTGMLNTAPTADADDASPLRAAEAYQFIPSDASPPAILADALIDLVYAVNSRYRSMGTFVFNSLTAGAVRKLKDTTGQYHWQPGLALGEPSTLLGYPTAVWEQMDDVALNAHPVAFGNFNRGYVLTDRVGMRITVDQVTNPGFVKYYIRRREGGKPLNNDAIKFLKTI